MPVIVCNWVNSKEWIIYVVRSHVCVIVRCIPCYCSIAVEIEHILHPHMQQGDNIQAKDILKQTVLQSESGASSQEKAVGDDSIKVGEHLLPKVEESLDEPEPAAPSSAPMLPSELLSTSPTEAPDDMSQLKRSIAGAGEEKQEWILPTEAGILDDRKDGISSDEAKENSFVDAKELNTNPESLLDKLFGKSKLEKGSLQDGGHPNPTLTDEVSLEIHCPRNFGSRN